MRKETIGRKHRRTRECSEQFSFTLLAETPAEADCRPWLSDTGSTVEHAAAPFGAVGAGSPAPIRIDPFRAVEVR